MIDINELRDRAVTFGSDYLTDEEWVAVIDRLEAAEKAVTEAYRRGYATGQEEIEKDLEIERMRLAACGVAALGYFEGCAKEYQSASLADVIALRKRFEASESDVSAWKGLATQFSQEADALRARIERMERQEPVAEWIENRFHRYPQLNWADGYRAVIGEKLYALPGAQPAPNIPPELEPNGMYDGSHHYASGWNDCRAAMLEAQPEAKP